MKTEDIKIAVVGLGYVGLPLAVAFSEKFDTLGYNNNKRRISELINGFDRTGEVHYSALSSAKKLILSSETKELSSCNIFVITVPTPIDSKKIPDLNPLTAACEVVGAHMNKGSIVIFESTVYPGATEEDCIPILEKKSGLVYNSDFFAGYSPERINPGDKSRPLTSIVKITSGSTPEIADFVDRLYSEIITAGTYKAKNIKVAEAAKIIENTQRDVNIALMNELSIIFHHLGLDTNDVLDAAGTKWNFIKLKPGLVGGHCIGVDPYYLLQKSIQSGFVPDIIRQARQINDNMPKVCAEKLIFEMIKKGLDIKESCILILGITFKENCSDVRNSKVVDLVKILRNYVKEVDIIDPSSST